MGDLLNNLPLCQLVELQWEAKQKKIKRPDIPCQWCESSIPNPKPQQKFCSTRCRVGFADALYLARLSNLEREKADWVNERIALLAEIIKLKGLLNLKG